MRSSLKYVLAAASLAIIVSPAWARTDSMDLSVDHPFVVGTTTLQPGTYEVKADEDKDMLQVQQDGKTVATVQGHWAKLAHKPDYSSAQYNGNALQEVSFEGNSMEFQVGK